MSFFSKTILNPAGGMTYHWTALRRRSTAWRPFCSDVEKWLKAWNPKSSSLVIFGSSAGWTLPPDFLSRFEKIVCVEPDPIARLLFRMRFRKFHRRIQFARNRELLPWLTHDGGLAFSEFLNQHRSSAILFANLIGQIQLLLPQELSATDERNARETFLNALHGREWASYHDIFSSSNRPTNIPESIVSPQIDSLAKALFPMGASLLDHGTLWLSENTETQLSSWHLKANHHHVIGFVQSSCAITRPQRPS